MNRIELLKEANSLFLENNFADALKLYQTLADDKNSPHRDLYAYNIFYCRRKLGISTDLSPKVDSVTEQEVDLFSGDKSRDIVFIQGADFELENEQQIEKLLFYISPFGPIVQNVYIVSDSFSSLDVGLIKSDYASLCQRINLIKSKDFNKSFVEALSDNTVAYIYHEKSIPDDIAIDGQLLRALAKKSGNIWRVSDLVQHHGSFFLKSLSDHFSSEKYQEQLRCKLQELKAQNYNNKCYVLGTGPSLKYSYCNEDAQESIVITCNSVVKNPTMLEFLKPEIVCATDPIFHAGWGQYGDEFRTQLIKSMEKHDFFLVVPHRDVHIYLNTLPSSLHHRIGAYEFDNSIEVINTDLIASLRSAPKPNVLTNIMLPIAATISKEILVGGCDGKKDPSSYFWEHDKSSQLNNQMDDIKKEFKGFFDISYDNYYAEHCKTVASQVASLEQMGYRISTCTPSYIPALAERLDLHESIALLDNQQRDVGIIMPSHNMADTLAESVRSVFKSAKDANLSCRVVLINECSVDDTLEVVGREFDEQVKSGDLVVVNTVGLGVSCARNIGLALNNSTYLGFLDADDLFSENCLREKVAALKNSNDDVVGAFSQTRLVNVESKEIISVANNYGKPDYRYSYKNVHAPAHISSILYKCQAVDGITFPEGIRYGEDWLFLSRVLRGGGELVFCNEPYTVYSIHASSATKKSPENHIISLFDIISRVYFSEDDIDGSAEFFHGLNSVKGSFPTYERKLSELVVRLFACFYLKNQANGFHKAIVELNKKFGLEKLDLQFAKIKSH